MSSNIVRDRHWKHINDERLIQCNRMNKYWLRLCDHILGISAEHSLNSIVKHMPGGAGLDAQAAIGQIKGTFGKPLASRIGEYDARH